MAGDDVDLRAQLDADHARRLLAMLVSTSGRLAPVIDDWRAPLVQIAEEIVPTHADLFAVDVIDADTGVPQQVLWREGDRTEARPDRRKADWIKPDSMKADWITPDCIKPDRIKPDWTDVVRAGISAGSPSLHPDVTPARTGGAAPQTVLAAAADGLGLSSLAVLPVSTRGLTLGTLVVGTAEPRRGLRPSDVEVYQELAARLAMAIERVVLHQEARAATSRAVLNAQRLGRAAEAAPAIAASLDLISISEAAAAEAARVLEVPAAQCSFQRPSGARVTATWPSNIGDDTRSRLEEAGDAAVTRGRSSAGPALALPLTTATGAVHGYLAVYDPDERTFTTEEDFVLALLGQATAAAASRAELFEKTIESEARLRTAIDASPLAIVEIGPDGTLLDSNPAAAALFWLNEESHDRVIGHDATTTLLALRSELLGGADVVDRQVTFPRIGAPAVVARASGALLGSRHAEDSALFFVADVTQRLFLEREVQQSRRMESLGRLAGGVAHDFNNLLTIITGYSDILDRRLGDDHPQIEAVKAIQAAAARASVFTSQLLTISRRRIGREGAVDVNAVLRELMDVLPRLLTEDVELTVVRGEGELWVDIEAGQLEQVLLNLVVNARNAMPEGGVLTVTTELVEDSSLILIVVSDCGIGMDSATAERCFEPFFSGPGGAKGTGLGLATAYGIVEQAGGRITFDTAPGEGTTFSIAFPRAAAPEVDPDDESPVGIPDKAPSGSRTVLLVEDDPLIRSLADRVLSEAGYSVHAASSAEDAFDVAELLDDRFHVLVTDVVMPGVGGATLAAELSERVDGLRVVFMSGFIDDLRRQRLVRTHPSSVFLPKPFGPEELLTAVAAAMALDQGSKR